VRFAELANGDCFIMEGQIFTKARSYSGLYNAVPLDFNNPTRIGVSAGEEVELVDAVYGYREQGQNWQFYDKNGLIIHSLSQVELRTLSIGDFFSYGGASYMVCKPAGTEREVIDMRSLIYSYFREDALVVREPKL